MERETGSKFVPLALARQKSGGAHPQKEQLLPRNFLWKWQNAYAVDIL